MDGCVTLLPFYFSVAEIRSATMKSFVQVLSLSLSLLRHANLLL